VTTLLGKATEKVESPQGDEQDAIASQVLDALAGEQKWKEDFASNPEAA
jgi:hypothetical protein